MIPLQGKCIPCIRSSGTVVVDAASRLPLYLVGDAVHFIAMDFFVGSAMRLPVSLSVRATALSHLDMIHALGVAHNDLKSDNILVNDHGEVCFIDFEKSSIESLNEFKSRERKQLLALMGGDIV